jgi:hypothetical protein
MRGRIQSLLKPPGAEQRRRAPLRVDLPHFFRNLNLAFAADFLDDQAHGKKRRQVVGANGLMRPRMKWRSKGLGQVRKDVVPNTWNAILRQKILDGIHAEHSTSGELALVCADKNTLAFVLSCRPADLLKSLLRTPVVAITAPGVGCSYAFHRCYGGKDYAIRCCGK